MKLSSKILLVTIAIFSAGLVYLWPYLEMGFAGSARYTEQDKMKYEFYTPDVLKNLPRISDNYEFSYANVSGPGVLIYDVTFNGTADASKIYAYLKANGYQRMLRCDISGSCWQGTDKTFTVSVGVVHKPAVVIVSVMDSFQD